MGVVADHGETLAVGAEQLEDARLQRVGVLIFVDQDVIETPADDAADLVVPEQALPEEEQVVVVEHRLLGLAIDVALKEPLEVGGERAAPGECRCEHVLERAARREAAAVDLRAGRLAGKAALLGGEAQLAADEIDKILGIRAIVNGEAGRETDGIAVVAQQPHRDRMESAAPDMVAVDRQALAAHDRLDAGEHAGGGAAGEGEQEDARGGSALRDQMAHAMGQGGGLAGAGARDYEERPVAVPRGSLLLAIEL